MQLLAGIKLQKERARNRSIEKIQKYWGKIMRSQLSGLSASTSIKNM